MLRLCPRRRSNNDKQPLWEQLEPDGTLTEATDDDAATRGRAWSARNRGVWGRG